jgi:hypothetical protein
MKSKADEAINKFNEISSMLNNDEAWNKMNRRERKTKIEEISNQVRDIISKVAEFQKKEIANLGMDKKTSDDLLSVITDINSIIKDIAKIEKTMSYKAEEEEAKKYKVGDKVKTHPDENGDFMEGEVTKIEGTQITIKRKDGKEITKSANSIESKSENKKETLKLEKTIKATGKKPNKKYNEASKKVFEMICKKFEKDEKISGMKQWKKAEFCSPRFYTIGPNRTAIIKAIKLGFGLNDKTADLTQEFIDKLSS